MLAAWLVAVLAVLPPASDEGPAPLRLTWVAPEACPRAAEIERRVLVAVGETHGETLVADVEIVHTNDGRFALTLRLAGSGSRGLSASSCDALADAAVFILAIAIDPGAAERLGETATDPAEVSGDDASNARDDGDVLDESGDGDASTSSGEPANDPDEVPDVDSPTTIPEVSAAPTTETVPRESPDAAPPLEASVAELDTTKRRPDATARARERRSTLARTRLDVTMGGGAAFVLLPAPGGFVSAGLAVHEQSWRVELDGSYVTPSERRSPVQPAARGRFHLWAVITRGCWVPPRIPFELPLCAGLEAGGMIGEGVGAFVEAHRRQSPWVAASGSVLALWRPVPSLGLGLRAEGIVAITRPRFGTEQAGTLFRAPEGGARVSAVIAYRFR